MIRNYPNQTVKFQMVSVYNGSPVDTGSPVVFVSLDGVTSTGSGTITNAGNGSWIYTPTQVETNVVHLGVTMQLTGAVSETVNIYPEPGPNALVDTQSVGYTNLAGTGTGSTSYPHTGSFFRMLSTSTGAMSSTRAPELVLANASLWVQNASSREQQYWGRQDVTVSNKAYFRSKPTLKTGDYVVVTAPENAAGIYEVMTRPVDRSAGTGVLFAVMLNEENNDEIATRLSNAAS